MAPKSAAKNQRTSKTALSGVRPDALARHTGKKAAVSQTAARPAVKKRATLPQKPQLKPLPLLPLKQPQRPLNRKRR